jgi:hypothetical protein
MSTSTNLRGLIELVSAGAEVIFNKRGELSPFWHCIARDGTLHLVPAPPCDKDVSVAIMKCFMEEHDIAMCCFVDEAWAAHLSNSAEVTAFDAIQARGGGVADYPQRQEVVIFNAEDELGMMTASRAILRPHGKRPRLGPLVINDLEGWSSRGRFVGMLPRRGTVQ